MTMMLGLGASCGAVLVVGDLPRYSLSLSGAECGFCPAAV